MDVKILKVFFIFYYKGVMGLESQSPSMKYDFLLTKERFIKLKD